MIDHEVRVICPSIETAILKNKTEQVLLKKIPLNKKLKIIIKNILNIL